MSEAGTNQSGRIRLLLVDDEKEYVNVLSKRMSRRNIDVVPAHSGTEAIRVLREGRFDAAILDLKMEDMDGIDVLRIFKKMDPSLPVIMLTAKADEVDKIIGLEIGADDYVTKPFSVKELVARVRTVLRRAQEGKKPSAKERFEFQGLSIDYGSCRVRVEGRPVTLSPTELKLLFFLSRNPGRVYSRDQILARVWGDDTFITDRAVDVHIRRLRSVIEENMDKPQYILTVRGFGYKFADIR